MDKFETINNILEQLNEIEENLYKIDEVEKLWDNKCHLNEAIRKVNSTKTLLSSIE